MEPTVIASVLSLVGTLVGTFSGIYASSKLTIYRIEQLEKKVDRFASIEEKLFELEKHNAVQDERTETIAENIRKVEDSL